MNLGAFAAILAIQRPDRNDVTREDILGLAGRQPALAALMAIFMFGLTGIPPLAGFFGKLYVFGSAVGAGLTSLAIVGVINSAIAAYYYLRVTVEMFMAERVSAPASSAVAKPARAGGRGEPTADSEAPVESRPQPRITWPVWAVLAATAAGTLVLGLWQTPVIQSIGQAVTGLAMR
jgi:NADH:ubiquinone oxidoreductase subunit 2 (subunit N)